MNQQKIGKFIAELRKEKNLTQEQLANQLNITKNAVSKWERGISLMDLSLLKPLSEILDISITELLNGERLSENELRSKTENAIENTISISNDKIKKSKYKNIFLTICFLLVISVICFFGYKGYLLKEFTMKKPENSEEVAAALVPKKTIKIYKRTLKEEDYLVIDEMKIRNDFKDYKLEEIEHADFTKTRIYRNLNDSSAITFPSKRANFQLIDVFTSDEATFYGDDLDKNVNWKFNSADRKYFLLKNDINNDIDFFSYISKNYYVKNHIFMDKRTLMENYSFNLFVSVVIPKVDEMILIKGDYDGVIQKIKDTVLVRIIRNGRYYGFSATGSMFQDESYLIDLIGTIEIK